jgi:hypothetical protein
VSGTDHGDSTAQGLDDNRRLEVATRLRDAVGLGDVTDIHQLADHLMRGNAAEIAVGERINRLATDFDFAALSELADSLIV